MKSFFDAIRNGEQGFVIRNSVYVPFHCHLLSIWIGKELSRLSTPDLIVDFTDQEAIAIREESTYTNFVFRKWGDLSKEFGHHKGHVILHAAEKGADIFNPENQHYIRLTFRDRSRDVFIEIIDDPLSL